MAETNYIHTKPDGTQLHLNSRTQPKKGGGEVTYYFFSKVATNPCPIPPDREVNVSAQGLLTLKKK